MTTHNWIGVLTGGPHYLDHLGVLCHGLGIPLLVTEQNSFDAAKEYYPGLDVEYIALADLTLDYLAQRADVIFESGHTFASELIPFWEMLHGKKMRVVYCSHGNSDKKSPKLRKDLSLIYGEHMKCHLDKTGETALTEKIVVTGNYRALYYRERKEWYDQKLDVLLDPNKKTVLYAPTWDHNGWYERAIKVIEEVGSQFNLLLRFHPFLEELHPVESEKIKALTGIDLSYFPSIYPILNRADYYLGDFSSVGYDFTVLNKPLFFTDRHEGEIYGCGITLGKDQHYGTCMSTFEDVFSEKRIKLGERVFGKEKNFELIKKEITEALSSERASWI